MRLDEVTTRRIINDVAGIVLAVQALQRCGPLTQRQRALAGGLDRSACGLERATKEGIARAIGWQQGGHTIAVERRAAPRWD